MTDHVQASTGVTSQAAASVHAPAQTHAPAVDSGTVARQAQQFQMVKNAMLRSTNLHKQPPSIAHRHAHGANTPEAAEHRADKQDVVASESFETALPVRVQYAGGAVVNPTVLAQLTQARKGSEPIVVRAGNGSAAAASGVSGEVVTAYVNPSNQSHDGEGDESGTMAGGLSSVDHNLDSRAVQEGERAFATALKTARASRGPMSWASIRDVVRGGSAAGTAGTPAASGAFSLASVRRTLARLVGISSVD